MPSGLTFNVYGHDVSAGRTIRGIGDAAEHESGRAGSAFKKAGAVIAGAFALDKVVDFLKDSFGEAEEAQKVGAQTAAVIKSTGGAAKVSAGQVGDLAGAISQKVGIDDEAIQSGENMLLTFTNVRNEVGKGNDIFNQATQTVTDMSVATGQSMTGSAVMLGKALNDPIAGVAKLTKIGVTFTQQQKDQIAALVASGNTMGAQKVILAELTKEFGGSAAAQATGADKAKVAFGNLEEQVGTALMPVITGLSNLLTNDVIPAFSAVVGFVDRNSTAVEVLGGTVLGLWGAYKGYTIARTALTAVSDVSAVLGGRLAGLGATGAAGMSRLGSAARLVRNNIGPIGVAVGLTTAAVAVGVGWWDQMHSREKMVADQTKELTAAIQADSGVLGENTRLTVANALQKSGAADDAQKLGLNLKTVTDAALGNSTAVASLADSYDSFESSRRQIMASAGSMQDFVDAGGNIQQLRDQKAAWDRLRDTVGDEGTAVGKAGAKAKQMSGLLGENTAASKKQADATKQVTQETKNALSPTERLIADIKKLSGDKIDAAQAELQFKDGLAGATQQVKDNGRSLSDNTAKGRSNREWLLQQIQSLNSLAQSQLDAGQSTATVTKKMGDNERALTKAATAAGLNRDQVRDLVKQYGQIPKSKSTTVSVSTSSASRTLTNFQTMINNLYGKKVVITQEIRTTHAADYKATDPRLNGHAQGGVQRGTGWSWVGENGPELEYRPGGTKTKSTSQSMSLAGMAGGGDYVHIEVNLPNAVVTQAEADRAVAQAVERARGRGYRV